jgi:hypothetical protein
MRHHWNRPGTAQACSRSEFGEGTQSGGRRATIALTVHRSGRSEFGEGTQATTARGRPRFAPALIQESDSRTTVPRGQTDTAPGTATEWGAGHRLITDECPARATQD